LRRVSDNTDYLIGLQVAQRAPAPYATLVVALVTL
jgi:hypothetical protein